jgi:hypothetical protein
MINVLITVIFLLANGKPAKDAWVYCDGVSVYQAGDDSREAIEDAPLVLDSRGAVIFDLAPTANVICTARQDTQWVRVTIDTKKKRQLVYLKEQP